MIKIIVEMKKKYRHFFSVLLVLVEYIKHITAIETCFFYLYKEKMNFKHCGYINFCGYIRYIQIIFLSNGLAFS